MRPSGKKYSIWPAVLPAATPVEMTITAEGGTNLPIEGETYRVVVIPMNGDEPNDEIPTRHVELKALAQGGVLRFTYHFPEEQEYLIQVEQKGKKKPVELSVYALRPDLYALRPMKGDLHSHSVRSDGAHDPARLHSFYREQGYEFHALTDHHRYHPGREIDAAYKGVKLGITLVQGEEVHAPGNEVHIVHLGGRASVAALYIVDEEGYNRDMEQYLARVPADIPEDYRYRYASCQWVCDRIHEAGGLAIFAHPYWQTPNRSYQICDELTQILLCSGMFDAYELVGGMGQAGINRSVTVWNELRAERGLRIPVVGTSDLHWVVQGTVMGPEKGAFMNRFTLCFAQEASEEALCNAIRDFRSVAVEATGEGENREYRCYGSLRLVSYAQFLLRRFYPRLQYVCQGEGLAMADYAMGDGSKELLERLVEQSERFRLRFFGQLPAPVPTAEVLAMEEAWGGITARGWMPVLVGEKQGLYPLK